MLQKYLNEKQNGWCSDTTMSLVYVVIHVLHIYIYVYINISYLIVNTIFFLGHMEIK